MKHSLKKEFASTTWLGVIYAIKLFITDYNLELLSIDMKKKGINYIATIEYDLGVGR